MAISHAHPLLFLFLASLFFLPSVFGTPFRPCNKTFDYPVVVKTVEISPHPVKRSTNGNITITGDASIGIPDGATVVLFLSTGHLQVAIRSYPLCDIVACPVKPGPIVLTFSNVFTKEELRPRIYHFGIGINLEEYQDPPETMCILFYCVVSGDTSLLRQVTE